MQAGVITIRDAVAAGLPRSDVRLRLAEGRWRQPFRGVLITDVTPVSSSQRLWAAVQAVGPDALLAGASAAALAGLVGYPSEPVTVLLPALRRASAPPGITLRHSARLQPVDVDPLGLPRRTTPSRSVVDMAEWASSRSLTHQIVTDAVLQGVVALQGLRGALARRGPISRRTLISETLDLLESDAPRLTEIRFRRLEQDHGLPEASYLVRGSVDEPISRLHVSFGSWRVRVEVAAAVTEPSQRRGAQGELVLALPARLVRETPREAAALLAVALQERGWVPPRRGAPTALMS